MSDYLYKVFRAKILKTFHEHQQEIYRYVTEKEDAVEKEVSSAGEFLKRLRTDAPYKLAAEHFHIKESELLDIMKQIELEIDRRFPLMIGGVKWVDYTESVPPPFHLKKDEKVFVVSFPD